MIRRELTRVEERLTDHHQAGRKVNFNRLLAVRKELIRKIDRGYDWNELRSEDKK